VKQPDWRHSEYLGEQNDESPPVRKLQVASQLLHEPAADAGANTAETTKLDAARERTIAIVFIRSPILKKYPSIVHYLVLYDIAIESKASFGRRKSEMTNSRRGVPGP
jgi:hypothetical protein